MTALAYGFTIRTTFISWREDDTRRAPGHLPRAARGLRRRQRQDGRRGRRPGRHAAAAGRARRPLPPRGAAGGQGLPRRKGRAASSSSATSCSGCSSTAPSWSRPRRSSDVQVDQDELDRRLAAIPSGGEQEGDANGDTYARDTMQARAAEGGHRRQVTRNVTGKTAAERAARRNQALAAFLARAPARDEGALRARLCAGLVARDRSQQAVPPVGPPRAKSNECDASTSA